MENECKEYLKKKVSRMEKLTSRIEELQNEMNKMEFVNETEKAGIRELAEKAYYDSVCDAIDTAVSDAIDRIGKDPHLRFSVANRLLEEIGLSKIAVCVSADQVFDEYMSRF